MKKILTVGDQHGKTKWFEKIQKFNEYENIIFIGDIFDSFDENIDNQILCFHKIIGLVKSNPNKYHVLLGNHDIHYLKSYFQNRPIIGSGFQQKNSIRISNLLKENLDFFKIAHQIEFDDKIYLFTHAGVTASLIEEIKQVKINKPYEDILDSYINESKISDLLNFCLFQLNLECLHYCGHSRGGYHKFSGPFWTGLKELENDCIQQLFPNFVQVVGHTRVQEPYIGQNNNYFIDSMDSKNPEIKVLNKIFVL